MRIMKVPVIISVLIALVFSSCQKELDIDLGNPPPPSGTNNDSIYISAYVDLDTALPSGQDTLYVDRFFYDNHKRVSYISTIETINSERWPSVMKYYYNGNDTLPYKITSTSADGNGVIYLLDTAYFTYASNGLISKDSGWSYSVSLNRRTSGYVTSFSGGIANMVFNYSTSYSTQPPTYDTIAGMVILDVSGQEIVSQTGPSLITWYEYFQMGYTDHPDPIYRTDFHYPIYYAKMGWGYGSARKLLISQDVGSGPNNIFYKYRWTYEYRADGYPLVRRGIDLLDPSAYWKELYLYTHL